MVAGLNFEVARLQRKDQGGGDETFTKKEKKPEKFSFLKETRFNPSSSNFWALAKNA